jgi:hypothetical protein
MPYMNPSISVQEIEKITHSIFDLEHVCAENFFHNEIKILHCISSDGEQQDSWQFHNFRLAHEEDVAAGEARIFAEVLSSSMLVINFCPFCGFKL